MTEDLERTLAELGPGYRELASRLTAAYRPLPLPAADLRRPKPRPSVRRAAGFLAAASLAAAVALVAVMGVSRVRRPPAPGETPRVYTVRASTAENEYRLALVRDDAAVQEMIRTQRPDGSWRNDFLTKRNAEVLKDCPGEAAQVAYKKAMRNLRSRGL